MYELYRAGKGFAEMTLVGDRVRDHEDGLAQMSGSGSRLRMLVAIASYGERNLPLLKRVIANYRRMDLDVDIVVLSEAPKDLGASVRVVVGLPSKDPWSLPFAHKQIFAENVARYDLFAYSEDDMEVTESNIRAFVRLTQVLDSDSIAGYLRYEEASDGQRYLPDVHHAFRWTPGSVRKVAGYTVAEFTNEHAAFYVLTRAQLTRAIASGGFLRDPCRGKHDMLCTAATDPYLTCGFRKVVATSHLDDFLIHHLSNRYAGMVGCSMTVFQEQLGALARIACGTHPVSTLCAVESPQFWALWAKSYYEKATKSLLEMVPDESKEILSIGCGWGATEVELAARGARVSALPLDSVIGAVAAHSGVDIIYGTLGEGLREVSQRSFDCILMTNLLHFQRHPDELIRACSRLLRAGGTLIVASPNFESLSILIKRHFYGGRYRTLRSFELSGINVFPALRAAKWMQAAGLVPEPVQWSSHKERLLSTVSGAFGSWQRARDLLGRKLLRGGYGRFTAENWMLKARKR